MIAAHFPETVGSVDAPPSLHRSGSPPDRAVNVVVSLEKPDKELNQRRQELMAKSPSCLKALKSKKEERDGT